MRHRAKCKLCGTVIDTDHNDYTTCACHEIAFDRREGRTHLLANDFVNMIGIDDEGNEHPINVISAAQHNIDPDYVQMLSGLDEKEFGKLHISSAKPEPESIFVSPLFALDQLIQSVENLPQIAMTTAITHYDYLSLLYMIKALHKEKNA